VFIGWGWCGLVAFLVDVICGRAHDGLSYCWGDMPGPALPISPVAGVLVITACL
jgi:hypothetical protein